MEQQDADIYVGNDGTLTRDGREFRCALGKGGVVREKMEGDGATPVGCFPIREVFYRKDRLGELTFPFPAHAVTPNDAWCDDQNDPRYNTHIEVDSAYPESLRREDHVYDVVAVLGYNDDPPVPGKGSAIFMHVAREGYTPTAGCIALSLKDLLTILQGAQAGSRVCVYKHV